MFIWMGEVGELVVRGASQSVRGQGSEWSVQQQVQVQVQWRKATVMKARAHVIYEWWSLMKGNIAGGDLNNRLNEWILQLLHENWKNLFVDGPYYGSILVSFLFIMNWTESLPLDWRPICNMEYRLRFEGRIFTFNNKVLYGINFEVLSSA